MRIFLALFLLLIPCAALAHAQKRSGRSVAQRPPEVGKIATVMDETISVLRAKPSLFAEPIQRMRMGRNVKITGVTEADGVKFFRVVATPPVAGWVQADAVFGKFRANDEERLARLVQASSGFEQIEAASHFFKLYPTSKFRPPILLLFGDLLEDAATKLSRDATNRLSRREMAASGAPLHSYYLNFVSIDRYRRLGIVFLFNSSTRQFHYDGKVWKEITTRFATSNEAIEAQKRLDGLEAKMANKPVR
jgi:hypothetical protein